MSNSLWVFWLQLSLTLDKERVNDYRRDYSNETLDTSIANSLCGFYLQMNGTGCLILDCMPLLSNFQIEKFLREFSFSSTAFYM